MKTFSQPQSIASMLKEPPKISAPDIAAQEGVPMLDLPSLDLPGAPTAPQGVYL